MTELLPVLETTHTVLCMDDACKATRGSRLTDLTECDCVIASYNSHLTHVTVTAVRFHDCSMPCKEMIVDQATERVHQHCLVYGILIPCGARDWHGGNLALRCRAGYQIFKRQPTSPRGESTLDCLVRALFRICLKSQQSTTTVLLNNVDSTPEWRVWQYPSSTTTEHQPDTLLVQE